MRDLKHKFELLNIEWDGLIIIFSNDMATILSPLQIVDRIASVSRRVQLKIYALISRIDTRKEMMILLENIARNLVAIRC